MFAADVDYHRATSVSQAVQLLGDNPGARLLAGGHSLIPLLKLRLSSPSALIDIGRVEELKGISVNGGTLRIGALTTHAELASSPEVSGACPMVGEAASMIGDPQVRNRATIGGNVAHADPASDLPSVLLALDATFNVSGPGGQRTVSASDFFWGLMTTALAENEVLTSVEVTVQQPGQGMAYSKFPHPASRYAVVGAAAVLTVSGGQCASASVAVGGVAARPARASSVEAALTGKALTDDVVGTASSSVGDDLGDDIMEDVFASAEYRRAMASVYVSRAVSAAAQRAA